MLDYPGMLIINPNKKISPKSGGSSESRSKQKTGFSGAESAIGAEKAFSSKMYVIVQINLDLAKLDILKSPRK